MARSVNFVWSFVNELSQSSIKERGVFLSAYDFHPYTKGANKELGLHRQTLQCIAGEHVTRRKQFKKARLNWRKSGGVRRSLGWIPIDTAAAQWKNGQVKLLLRRLFIAHCARLILAAFTALLSNQCWLIGKQSRKKVCCRRQRYPVQQTALPW